jgi:hypothetical protein
LPFVAGSPAAAVVAVALGVVGEVAVGVVVDVAVEATVWVDGELDDVELTGWLVDGEPCELPEWWLLTGGVPQASGSTYCESPAELPQLDAAAPAGPRKARALSSARQRTM